MKKKTKKIVDKLKLTNIQITRPTETASSIVQLSSYQKEIQDIINKNIKNDLSTCIFKPRQIGSTTYIIEASKKLLSQGKRVAIACCNESTRTDLQLKLENSEYKHKLESGDLFIFSTTKQITGKHYFDYLFLDELAHKYSSQELLLFIDACKHCISKLSGLIIITTGSCHNTLFYRYILNEYKHDRISMSWLSSNVQPNIEKHLSMDMYKVEYLNELI